MSDNKEIKRPPSNEKLTDEEHNDLTEEIKQFYQEEHKKALNKVRHRSIELFSERMILKKALKQINYQKLEIEKQRDEIKEKNKKLNKALTKARKRTIDLFGKHIDLKKAKKYISIINEDIEKKNLRLEKAIKKSKKRTIDLFGKHIDLKKAKKHIENQSKLLQKSYNELELKNIQINDSIEYARNIQTSIIPPIDNIKKCFPDSFVFFQPKDIVSGDFYWISEKGDNTYLAVVDCTGHGVPGAFMSMMAYTLLNQIVNENPDISTSEFLQHLNKEIFSSFYRGKEEDKFQNDGMDITLLKQNKSTNNVSISSAGQIYFVNDTNQINIFRDCLFGIGELKNGHPDLKFNENMFNIDKIDSLYMFSDGIIDQFGGKYGKKFRSKKLLQIIEENPASPMEEQKKSITDIFTQWKGTELQIDDICLIGISF